MLGQTLLEATDEAAAAGAEAYAFRMKQLVSRESAATVGRLNFADERPFSDPWLHAYFAHPEPQATLDQLLAGWLPPEDRPATVEVLAAEANLALAPNVGYVVAEQPGRGPAALDNATSTPLLHLDGTKVELAGRLDPLLTQVFASAARRPGQVAVLQPTGESQCALNSAVGCLKRATPALWERLENVTRRIVVFRSPHHNSFATTLAHGAVFLNAPPRELASTVFFIEDLAHQCGHVLFANITLRCDDYLTAPPDTPLQAGNDDRERRTLYTAFHGVFTEMLMVAALYACLTQGEYASEEENELLARLAFAARRFELDLNLIQQTQSFTDRGWSVYRECVRVFEMVFADLGHVLSQFDFRNQPYTFCYDRCRQVNSAELSYPPQRASN